MNYCLLSLLMILGLAYCLSPSNQVIADPDAKAILNLALKEAVGSDTTWRKHLRLPPTLSTDQKFVSLQDSIEQVRFAQWRDSIKTVLDTASLFVVINNHYDSLDGSDQENIHALLREVSADLDTGFAAALHALSLTISHTDSFSFSLLEPRSDYRLYTNGTAPGDKLRKLGSVSFSRIGFNATKDKACIYTRFICGGLCGAGQMHFFTKANGQWRFIKTFEMWVS